MIDIHAHLAFPDFDKDRDLVVAKCKKELSAVVVSSAKYDESLKVLDLASKNKNFLFATLGHHPTEGDDYEGVLRLIKQNKDRISGVGEAGLDFHFEQDKNKRKEQEEIFQKFIDLAERLKLPLVIHSWDAENECFEAVKDRDLNAVFHCYSGSRELAKEILERGFYISISTQVCFSKNHKKLAKTIPLEKMLLETDAPFLSPNKTENEKRNFPWNIKISAEKIAEIKKVSKEEILESAKNNAVRLFNLGLK